MASFLKIGNRVLNLDAVVSIDLDDPLLGIITVCLAGGNEVHFRGEDTRVLRNWLELTAIDATTAYVAS